MKEKKVILFGVPETPTKIDVNEIDFDDEKIDHIFGILDVNTQLTTKFMRLGKLDEGSNIAIKPRPIKLLLDTNKTASSILTESRKQVSHNPLKIVVKPDKSKAKLTELQRIGRRNTELLHQYPTQEDEAPRFKLQKGKLSLDGIIVDTYKPPHTLF